MINMNGLTNTNPTDALQTVYKYLFGGN